MESAAGKNFAIQKNDTTWKFHPFSVDIIVGSYIPIGKLNEQFKPSLQVGWSLGLTIYKNTRLSVMVAPRFLLEKRSLAVKVKDSIIYDYHPLGWSIGGLSSTRLYENKQICLELINGVTWEGIVTDVSDVNSGDSISISSLGLSLGLNTWFNIINRINLGVLAYYTFSTYDNSKYLANPIGNSSFNLSLIYRGPKRNQNR